MPQLNSGGGQLAAWRATGSEPVGLWIVSEASEGGPPQGWLPYTVAEPASLGLEFWLAAQALELDRVAITANGIPNETRAALQAQITLAQTLLTGMGMGQSIGWSEEIGTTTRVPATACPRPGADLPLTDDKRTLLFAAIDALMARTQIPLLSLTLPGGPFGEVRVDAAKCTLCAACVRTCPAEALSLPGTTAQLAFTEERCVQCGICANACPEKAISLVPRLLGSKTARQPPRVIAEAEMFACSGCGKPFASKAQIARSRALMAGHPMFQGEQARLTELCPDCRQRAMAGLPM